MSGVNKVILIGFVGRHPDIRTMGNGEQVASFSLATSETWKDKRTGEKREKTEWHRIVAYRKLAEIIGQYVRKGSRLYLEGKLQTRKWQGNDGQDRYTTEIIVNSIQMLDSRQDAPRNDQHHVVQRNDGAQRLQYQATGAVAAAPPQEAVDFDDDEIPF